MKNEKSILSEKIIIDFIKKNNYNIFSIFTTNEKGKPIILKQNSDMVTLEINAELENLLKSQNLSESEIQTEITVFLTKYLEIINQKEKNDNSTI